MLMRLGENNFYFRETVRRMGGRGGERLMYIIVNNNNYKRGNVNYYDRLL